MTQGKHYLASADKLIELAPNIPEGSFGQACATTLPGNKIMMTGGLRGFSSNARTHIYDVDEGVWSKGPDMLYKRRAHGCTSITLAHGTTVVIVAGGSINHDCKQI